MREGEKMFETIQGKYIDILSYSQHTVCRPHGLVARLA
jgi:hypothetical protein